MLFVLFPLDRRKNGSTWVPGTHSERDFTRGRRRRRREAALSRRVQGRRSAPKKSENNPSTGGVGDASWRPAVLVKDVGEPSRAPLSSSSAGIPSAAKLAFFVGRRAWTECAETISCRCRLSHLLAAFVCWQPVRSSARRRAFLCSCCSCQFASVVARRPSSASRATGRTSLPGRAAVDGCHLSGSAVLRRKPPVGVPLRWRPLFGLQR